jgi:hypothetical protein
MREIKTQFLLTIALDVPVLTLGDTPMAGGASHDLVPVHSKGLSSRERCCPVAVAGC